MTLLPLAHHLLNVADQEDPIWVPAEDAPRYDHSHWVGITLNLPSCEMLLLRVGGGGWGGAITCPFMSSH